MQLRGAPVLDAEGKPVGRRDPVDLGQTQDDRAYAVDMTVVRRPATAEDLARLSPPASAPAVRAGPAMHRLRPATGAASWRNYRSALGTPVTPPDPVTTVTTVTPPEEAPVTVTASPPSVLAIPCKTCLHMAVCGDLKAAIDAAAEAVERIDTRTPRFPDLRIRVLVDADCGHYLARPSPAGGVLSQLLDEVKAEPARLVETTRIDPEAVAVDGITIRREHGGESWRTDKAPKEEPAPERLADAKALRYPLPRDPAERNRLVLEAVRETPDLATAGARLGVSDTRVSQILRVIRQAGEMPEDLEAIIQTRNVARKVAAS